MGTPDPAAIPAASQRHTGQVAALRQSILGTAGLLPSGVREALAAGQPAEGPLEAFAARVRDDPSRITDQEVEFLRAGGCNDDEILEATLAAAFGAAERRWRAGRQATFGEA